MTTPPPKYDQICKGQKYSRLSSRSPNSANEDSFDDYYNGKEGEQDQEDEVSFQQQNGHEVGNHENTNNSTLPPSSIALELSSFPINGQHHYEKSTFFEKFFSRRFKYLASHLKTIFVANFVDDRELLKLYRKLCCSVFDRRVDNNSLSSNADDQDINVGDWEGKDDGGLVLMKLLKLWTLVILGIFILHPFARWMVSSSLL